MSIASKIVNFSFDNKLGKLLISPNAPAAAATIATISNITKDGVNCYYYVTQSLHNEKIPEEKRKFVAGLDLANGLLNVITQSFVAVGVTKMTNKLFSNVIEKKYFSKEALTKLYSKIKTNLPLDNFLDNMEKYKIIAKSGLAVISALVATQIIAKRIIVPLIATPLASVFKKQFEKNEAKNNNTTDKTDFSNNNPKKQTETQNTKNTNTSPLNTNCTNLPKCFQGFNK